MHGAGFVYMTELCRARMDKLHFYSSPSQLGQIDGFHDLLQSAAVASSKWQSAGRPWFALLLINRDYHFAHVCKQSGRVPGS